MLTEATCPSLDELRRLLAGQLPPAAVEQIKRHLETCAVCPQTLVSMGDENLAKHYSKKNSPGHVSGLVV